MSTIWPNCSVLVGYKKYAIHARNIKYSRHIEVRHDQNWQFLHDKCRKASNLKKFVLGAIHDWWFPFVNLTTMHGGALCQFDNHAW